MSVDLQGQTSLKSIDNGQTVSSTRSSTRTHAPLPEVTDQGKEALKDITYGSIAGIVGKFIEYPFDTVKVRLQSQPDRLPLRYTGPLDCFRQSLRNDGFLGIYRGISAPLFGAAVETSSLFFSYRLAQDALTSTICDPNKPITLPWLTVCGAVSGAFTSLALTPIELVKCKMQVPLETGTRRISAPGAWAITRSVYAHQGLLGFWHGQLGTLIRETGGSAAWFGSYEVVSLLFRKTRHAENDTTLPTSPIASTEKTSLPVWQQMVAGAAAGMSYNFIFYPADTIKSRMQTEDVSKMTGGRTNFWAAGKALWRQHGLRGLYRGCGITVGRAAPSSAFIFSIYEGLRSRIG